MSIIKFKAKVLLTSEDDMEIEGKHDFGNIAKSTDWVWRNVAIPAEDIKNITEYSNSKCIVETVYEEKILVAEAFEPLSSRWDELREEYELEEEINEGSENSSEGEDD